MRIFSIIFLSFFICSSTIAQYEPDRHSTNYYDAWLSCEQTEGPIDKWGERHWLKYEFDAVYVLGKMKIWNYNDRENNGFGVRDVIVSYSVDGLTWEEWGLYSFERTKESSFYQGDEGPDFDGLEAKYLLFTVLSSYGGGACVGIGEIKIETEGWSITEVSKIEENLEVNLFPNPSKIKSQLNIELSDLSPLSITIIDQSGKRVKTWQETPTTSNYQKAIDLQTWTAGVYFVYVRQNNKVSTKKLTVIQ